MKTKEEEKHPTLACVLLEYRAALLLEPGMIHPQWRQDEDWETVVHIKAAIMRAYPDVRFLDPYRFQLVYARRRREGYTQEERSGTLEWPRTGLDGAGAT